MTSSSGLITRLSCSISSFRDLTVVPSYIGGFMALAWCSKKTDISNKKISKKKLPVILALVREKILVESVVERVW